MSENTIRNIFKYVSIAFIVLSASMLFVGGVGVSDAALREKMSTGVDEAIEKIDMDDGEIADAEAGMAMFGVEIDIRSLTDQMKRVLNILRDGRLSASEIAFTGTTAIRLIDELKGNKLLSLLSGQDLDELLAGLDSISMRMYIVVAFFWITLLCAVVVIVLHILNLKLPGASVVLFNLLWLIVFIVIKSNLNEMIVDKLDGPDGMFAVTAAPAIAFTAAVMAMVLWIIKDMVAGKATGDTVPFYTGPEPGYQGSPAGVTAETIQTENADDTAEEETYVDMVEYATEPPTAITASVPVSPAGPAAAEDIVYSASGVGYDPGDLKFCPKCGAAVDHDYDFCGTCGFRIFSR